VVERVEDMKTNAVGFDNKKMEELYGRVFGSLFPYLEVIRHTAAYWW